MMSSTLVKKEPKLFKTTRERIKHARHDGRWMYHLVLHPLHDWGVPEVVVLSAFFVGLLFASSLLVPNFGTYALLWLAGMSPIWLPITLGVATWAMWVWYIRGVFIAGQTPVLLEIKIPREISKSPRAMEVAIDTIYSASGESNFIARGWQGKVRTWFALEIVSIGGKVHFYVWCWAQNRNIVEAALYAQFPDIEIHQVEDYAASFHWDPETYGGHVIEYTLGGVKIKYKEKKEDKELDLAGLLPIRTYIDFELEKDPKEEFKIDPLAQVLEFMSQLKPHEQVWLQIVYRTAGKSGGPLNFDAKNDETTWRTNVTKAVEAIRKASSSTYVDERTGEERSGFPNPTWAQKQQIENMERQLGKTAFEVGMRGAYIANIKQGSVVGSNIGAVRTIWRPFNSSGHMGKLSPAGGTDILNYPWQDYGDWHKNHIMHQFFDAYRRRSFFFAPYIGNTFVTTPEVLATIWHFPSSTITAPGIERIPATKAEAPSNLPI